jgi:hypothetical protein
MSSELFDELMASVAAAAAAIRAESKPENASINFEAASGLWRKAAKERAEARTKGDKTHAQQMEQFCRATEKLVIAAHDHSSMLHAAKS